MNIEITKKEYRDLLDILHIADVIMSGHRREEDKRTEHHRALIQKLYSVAESEGFGHLIGKNQGVDKYLPTGEFEEASVVHRIIDEFGEHFFWDQLISRLSARDAALLTGGMDNFSALGENDREQMEGPIREHYLAEFSANGVANLEVVERFGVSEGLPVKTSD